MKDSAFEQKELESVRRREKGLSERCVTERERYVKRESKEQGIDIAGGQDLVLDLLGDVDDLTANTCSLIQHTHGPFCNMYSI